MKKVLLAFAVASVFAACDDSSKTESTITDSTNLKVDSLAITPAVTDTIAVDTSANKMSADTSHK
ncbi:MAG TPA: hypothetical protein VMY77_11215 [Chitinophagaceae bacterium]|nr:hypothetical protein [Chitinophagaceae bacterium]